MRADRILIEPDSGISVTGGGVVTLTSATAGHGINLGVATDGVTAMELSDAELDRIFAANVVIGGTEAGTLNVDGAITHLNSNLTLRSGADILINANITTPQTLTLFSGDSILQAAASGITTGTFVAFGDNPDFDPAGTFLSLSGTMTATSSTLHGNADDDTLIGNALANVLVGSSGNDTLRGFGGPDYLDGGSGNDTMTGGPGNDTIIVDSALDVVIEAAGEGFDNVAAMTSYQLGAGAEVEVLSTTDNDGTFAFDLIGNAFGQSVIGNHGNNYLDGGGGADLLIGRGGNDTMIVDADDVVIGIRSAAASIRSRPR